MAILHPIFSVIVSRPELVVNHVAAYAALVHEEASSIGRELAKRAIAWGIAVLSFTIFLTLAGVAAMLGVMDGSAHWVLFVVPGIALVITAVAAAVALKPMTPDRFKELKAQIDADAQALRAAGDAR